MNTQAKVEKSCIIWMHGLGADPNNMAGIAQKLPTHLHLEHVLLAAPIRSVTLFNHMAVPAWYDILGSEFSDREDKVGIEESEAMINAAIAKQIAANIPSQRIFLAGFSQGAAMALYTGIRSEVPLGGIIALSGYLPLPQHCNPVHHVPVFVGLGVMDQVVKPEWTRTAVAWLRQHGYNKVTEQAYPIEHAVSLDEIRDISAWLTTLLMAKEEQLS